MKYIWGIYTSIYHNDFKARPTLAPRFFQHSTSMQILHFMWCIFMSSFSNDRLNQWMFDYPCVLEVFLQFVFSLFLYGLVWLVLLAQVLLHPQLIFPSKTWFFEIYLNFQWHKSLKNQYLPHSKSKSYQINSIKS